MIRTGFLFLFIAQLAAQLAAAAATPGAVVADFALKDIHRRPRSLADFKDKKAFVVFFADTECPVANLFVPSLLELHRQYADKGVQFLAINSSRQDTYIAVSAHAQEREIPFPVLKDFDQQVADAFGARVTPEAFLLDAGRVIRYRGRIDDQYGIGVRRDQPTRRDLKEALDELLAGKPITTPQTRVDGCPIERVGRPGVAGAVTYAKHVSRIVQKHCQECHRPGQIAPFSLLGYEDAQSRSQRIRAAVVEERMPPWHADPRFGKFANERRLSQEERATLLAWLDQGMPRGTDRELPAPAQFPADWKIGTPDAVFPMAEEFKVPAAGILDYQKFTVDPGFKKDVWVQAAECRPGNRAVVHHILVYIQERGKPLYDFKGRASTLVGWAPGDMPALYAPGTAKKIPAGARLVFEVHYTPNGMAQTDRSSVGLIFASKPPALEAEANILANMLVRIPPHAPNHRGQLDFTFSDDALILSFLPHMHLRGTSAKYVATYPDGKQETLLYVPDYDFNWQTVYRFAEPVRIPRGTRLRWMASWDNSADNPRNPDPTREVRWGLQTFDEMQNGWMDMVWLRRK
jgi:peroxiredoxin/mono/diheme cytochrome c family protein